MKHIALLLSIFISINIFSQQWKNLTNKDFVYSFDEDEENLYLGTNGGLVILDKETKKTTTNFRADKGIPDNHVMAILKENNGIWLGSRFSGIGFLENNNCTNYNFLNSNIPHDQFNSAIATGSNGNKYIGSLGFVSKFENGNFEIIHEMNPLIAFDNVNDIKVDQKGIVWIACYSGLYKYDGNNSVKVEEVIGFNISSIVIDENILWVSSNQGLYTKSNNEWTCFNENNSELPQNEVFRLSMDAVGNLWIGMYDYLSCYTVSGEWINYLCNNETIGEFHIFSLYHSENGELWIGTRKNGLLLFEDGIFNKVEYTKPSVLPSNNVNMIKADNKLWFGWDNGLFNLDGEKHDTLNSNLEYPQVFLKAVDNEGNIWLTNKIYDAYSEEVISDKLIQFNGESFDEIETPFPIVQPIVLSIDKNGVFWFGVQYYGLYKWDGINWTNYNIDNSPLSSNIYNAIDFDSNGNIWIGQNGYWDEQGHLVGGGLMKFNGSESWTEYNVFNSGLPYNSITALELDKNDNVWLGTVNDGRYDGGGLTMFDGNNWVSYKKENSEISDNQIISLIEDTDGNIWGGSIFGGLIKYDKQDSWTIFMKHNSGIAENYVSNLIEKENHIYMSHHVYTGASVFDKNTTNNSPSIVENDFSVQVYPNPTSDYIIVECKKSNESLLSLKIYDLSGRQLYQNDNKNNASRTIINLNDLINPKTGILILELRTNNELITKKIIVSDK